MDEGTGQTSQEKVLDLRKRVADALDDLVSVPSISDKPDRAQVEKAVYGFLGACRNLATAQKALFFEEISYATDIITEVNKVPDDEFPHLSPKELAQGILSETRRLYAHLAMDSLLIGTLMDIATLLVMSMDDLESMRNTMATYSELMGKFKALVEDKATGKAVESWFNTIWDRQVKRGVVQ